MYLAGGAKTLAAIDGRFYRLERGWTRTYQTVWTVRKIRGPQKWFRRFYRYRRALAVWTQLERGWL
jgi:hypothetical protein